MQLGRDGRNVTEMSECFSCVAALSSISDLSQGSLRIHSHEPRCVVLLQSAPFRVGPPLACLSLSLVREHDCRVMCG